MRKVKLDPIRWQTADVELVTALRTYHEASGIPGSVGETIKTLLIAALNNGDLARPMIHNAQIRAYNRLANSLRWRIADELEVIKRELVTSQTTGMAIPRDELEALEAGEYATVDDDGNYVTADAEFVPRNATVVETDGS